MRTAALILAAVALAAQGCAIVRWERQWDWRIDNNMLLWDDRTPPGHWVEVNKAKWNAENAHAWDN